MQKHELTETINYVMEKKRVDKKYRELNSAGKKVIHYVVLGGYLGTLYRQFTDHCRKSCGTDQKCYNKCYLMACNKAVAAIQGDIKKAQGETSESKKARKLKKLNKELTKWQAKAKKYSDRMQYGN